MAIKDIVRTGDVLLICPKNTIGHLIAKFTFGKVNHAAIVYDDKLMFETDADLFRAGFADLDKYAGRDIVVVRPKYMEGCIDKMQELCNAYSGSPYSYWDIATNATFFFLTRQIRNKVVGLFGNKNFMVCSELVSRILYESSGNKIWRDFEGMTPEDIRDIAMENPESHEIINIKAS